MTQRTPCTLQMVLKMLSPFLAQLLLCCQWSQLNMDAKMIYDTIFLCIQILGPKKMEATIAGLKLHDDNLHNLWRVLSSAISSHVSHRESTNISEPSTKLHSLSTEVLIFSLSIRNWNKHQTNWPVPEVLDKGGETNTTPQLFADLCFHVWHC